MDLKEVKELMKVALMKINNFLIENQTTIIEVIKIIIDVAGLP